LSEFRQRLLTNEKELLVFDLFLTQIRERGYLNMRGQQRTDSTHVLAKIRSLNRVEGVGEPFRAVLNSLAVVAPSWLKEQWQEGWIERYEHRVEDYRLPDGKQPREASAIVVGKDGAKLLDALYADAAPIWLREIPTVQTLRRVWVQNFYWEEEELHWRDLSTAPAAGALINSPYDPEALFAQKRETRWVGYKVHLTETCDDDSPHVITHVETTPAPQADDEAIPHIHKALATHNLLPQQPVVETGYGDRWNSSTVSRTMAWISLGQHERIIIGKRAKRAVVRHRTSTSIGSRNVLRVPQARPVAVGRLPRIDVAIPSSRSNLRCKIVALVRAVHNAPKASPTRRVGSSRYGHNCSIRPCKPHANGKPLKSSKWQTTDVPGLRAHSLRAFVLSGYGEHATKGEPTFNCSRSSPPLRSTSAAFLPGSLSNHEPKHDRLLLCDSPKKELNSMSFCFRQQYPQGCRASIEEQR